MIELPRHDTYATVTPPRAHLLIHDADLVLGMLTGDEYGSCLVIYDGDSGERLPPPEGLV